jgi:hypothetical protein
VGARLRGRLHAAVLRQGRGTRAVTCVEPFLFGFIFGRRSVPHRAAPAMPCWQRLLAPSWVGQSWGG